MDLVEAALGIDRIAVLGRDVLLEHVLSNDSPGFAMTSCQLYLKQIPLTVVGVPDRLWHNDEVQDRLLAAQQQMQQIERRCIFMPHNELMRMYIRGDRVRRDLLSRLTGIYFDPSPLDPDAPLDPWAKLAAKLDADFAPNTTKT